MKKSNPPSYDKIFPIKMGATESIGQNEVIPPHRGLLIVATATVSTIVFKNLDDTQTTMQFSTGSIVLPLQIKSYSGSSSVTFIYGLL